MMVVHLSAASCSYRYTAYDYELKLVACVHLASLPHHFCSLYLLSVRSLQLAVFTKGAAKVLSKDVTGWTTTKARATRLGPADKREVLPMIPPVLS